MTRTKSDMAAEHVADTASEETPIVALKAAPKAEKPEPEPAEPAVAVPAKRGRGRPRKNPLAEIVVPVRRGPGRPRKNPVGGEVVAPKRGPGRPRKAAMDTNERLLRIEQRLDTIVAELARVHERLGALAGGEPAAGGEAV